VEFEDELGFLRHGVQDTGAQGTLSRLTGN